MGFFGFGVAAKGELVNEALPACAVVRQNVFHFLKLVEMCTRLELAPTGERADIAPGKNALVGIEAFRFTTLFHQVLQQAEQSPRLRRQFIQRTPQDFVGDAVGGGDVGQGRLDVFQGAFPFDRPLMLVQQGNACKEAKSWTKLGRRDDATQQQA